MRKAQVFASDVLAGILEENDDGYSFAYDENYLANSGLAISLTLPLTNEPYVSKSLFSFFDGIIPEGWLLDIVAHNWKINASDRFGILLVACADPIGNISIKEIRDEM